MNQGVKKELIAAFVGAGLIVVPAFGASIAQRLGYVDHETVVRASSGPIGLYLAWYGNLMPKTFFPSAWARQARQVAGWTMVVSGLVYTGLWVFAPIPLALPAGIGAILLGFAVNLGNCLTVQAKAKAS